MSDVTNRWLSKKLQGFLHSVSAIVGKDSNDDLNVLYIDSNGFLRGNLSDAAGNPINPATEDTVSQLVMAVNNAIDETAFDLNAAAFSEVTVVSNDYIFDSIELNFSTAEAKTITITSEDGTILWGGDVDQTAANQGYLSTAKNIYLEFNRGFKGGENITVAVTQLASPGIMDCILKVRSGTNSLLGNPDVRLVQTNGVVIEDNNLSGSNALPVIETEHARIHNGQGYICSNTITVTAASSLDFLIANPAGNVPHMRLVKITSTQGNGEVIFYKDATVSGNGDVCASFNMDDNSSNTADLVIYTEPTVTDAGTQVEHDLIVGGKQSGGSLQSVAAEFITKLNGNRLVRYNNISNQDDVISFKFFWYES